MKSFFSLLVPVLLSLFVTVLARPVFATDSALLTLPEPQPGDTHVSYDAATDLLAVEATGVPLTMLLQRIARLSGVEILIDPAIERQVTLHIDRQPLEQGLRNLTRGLNIVLIHDEFHVPGKGVQNLLVRVQLLPPGQTSTALLVPVLSPEAEAMLRADQRYGSGSRVPGLVDDRRRMARLQKLPPEQRERLAQIEEQRVRRDLQHKAEQAERRAQRKLDRLARLNERLQRALEAGKGNPERQQASIDRIRQDIAEIQAELNATAVP